MTDIFVHDIFGASALTPPADSCARVRVIEVGGVDKQAIFTQVSQIEERIGDLYIELGGLKEQIVQLIEENTRLVMENQSLREQLKTLSRTEEGKNTRKRSEEPGGEGYDNLTRLYNEGFHICNVHYGSMRTDGDCLFCLSFLNK